MKPLAPVMAMRMTEAKGGGAQDGHNAHGVQMHPTPVSLQQSAVNAQRNVVCLPAICIRCYRIGLAETRECGYNIRLLHSV